MTRLNNITVKGQMYDISPGVEGAEAVSLPAGSEATAEIDENNILQLGIPRGADGQNGSDGSDAVNPFKGWYNSLAELKAAHTAIVGDSAYVKDASPSTTWSIYVYDSTASSDNYWADSGTDADTSNVQTFASGEEVNETHIDNTILLNPKQSALAKAQDVCAEVIKEIAVDLSRFTPVAGYITGTSSTHTVFRGKSTTNQPNSTLYRLSLSSIGLEAGDYLRFDAGQNGARICFAVSGGTSQSGSATSTSTIVLPPTETYFRDISTNGTLIVQIPSGTNYIFFDKIRRVSGSDVDKTPTIYTYEHLKDDVDAIEGRVSVLEDEVEEISYVRKEVTLYNAVQGTLALHNGSVYRLYSSYTYGGTTLFRMSAKTIGIGEGDTITVIASENGDVLFCFAKSGGTSGSYNTSAKINLADGEESYRSVPAGTTQQFTVPSNTNLLFVNQIIKSGGELIDVTPYIEITAKTTDFAVELSGKTDEIEEFVEKITDFREDTVDVSSLDKEDGYYNLAGEFVPSDPAGTYTTCTVICDGYDMIGFKGLQYGANKPMTSGVLFYDSEGVLIEAFPFDYRASGSNTTITKDYLRPIPDGAVTAKLLCKSPVIAESSFFCYMQKNPPVEAKMRQEYIDSKILKYIGRSDVSEKDNWGGFVFAHVTDCHGRTGLTTSKIVFDKIVDRINWIKKMAKEDGFEDFITDFINTGDMIDYFGTIPASTGISFKWMNRIKNMLVVLGNHDTKLEAGNDSSWPYFAGTEAIYNKFIGPNVANWDVTQPANAETNHYCYYSKLYEGDNDNPSLLALFIDSMDWGRYENRFATNYHQRIWCQQMLESARQNGYHVVIFVHTTPIAGGYNVDPEIGLKERGKKNIKLYSCSWNPNNSSDVGDAGAGDYSLCEIVRAFQVNGGVFVGYIMGHNHSGYIGSLQGYDSLDPNDVANSRVYYNEEYPQVIVCGTFANVTLRYNSDVSHTSWEDVNHEDSAVCFRLVGIDTRNKIIKIKQIGRNTVWDMREKKPIGISYRKYEQFCDYPNTNTGNGLPVRTNPNNISYRSIIEKDGKLWSFDEVVTKVVEGVTVIDWDNSQKRIRGRVLSEEF